MIDRGDLVISSQTNFLIFLAIRVMEGVGLLKVPPEEGFQSSFYSSLISVFIFYET